MIKFLLNKIVSIIRKDNSFKIDNNVPNKYVLSFLVNKTISFFFGQIKLFRIGPYFVHPSVKLDCISKINTTGVLSIAKNCHISGLSKDGISFGKNISIHANTSIECSGTLLDLGKGIVIGDNVGIGRNCHFGGAGGLVIGSDTIFGQYVSIHPENHNFKDLTTPIRRQGVNRIGINIGENCWIGSKVTILDGVNIKNGVIIAAGALVLKGTYEENLIYGGVPAKKIGIRG